MTKEIHDRIRQAIAAKGLSEEAASKAAGLDRGYLQKLFERENASPRTDTLKKLAHALGVTTDWLMHGSETLQPARSPGEARFVPGDALVNPFDLPRDVPVLGTAAGSHTKGAFQISGGPIDFVRRPPGLSGARDVYGLYIEGTSMEPQFSPGDLVYVHPHRPARIGDPVVVQSRYRDDHEVEATIGVYRRQTEKFVVIQKWNPPAEVEILRNGATLIHRIMRTNELYGI